MTLATKDEEADAAGTGGAPALCLVGACAIRSWGLTPAERTERLFVRHGAAGPIGEDTLAATSGPVILVRADAVIDPPLVPALIGKADTVLMSNFEGTAVPVAVHASAETTGDALKVLAGDLAPSQASGLTPLTPDGFGATFWEKLRKRETPYALIISAGNQRAAEWRMFMGTYKGATDFVTKHFWPRPAFALTRVLAPAGITPNMVTTLGAVLVVAAYFLFEAGAWWTGLLAAWLMTFLDTVDGKLARTALKSSKWGDIFDHGIDLIHPPFWYAAWAIGVQTGPFALSPVVFWWSLGVIVGGYLMQRAIEGISIKRYGLEIHIWRPIDTLFRQVTARRNPNLALLTLAVIAGRPDAGLVAVAVWTAICLLLHGIQLIQADAAFRRDGRLVSWMTQPV